MPNRSTTIRDKHRAILRRDEPPCYLCGEPIDYTLPYLDPGSYVVDHVIPVDAGGPDTIENKQAAHRSCNRAKSNKLDTTGPKRTFVTDRVW